MEEKWVNFAKHENESEVIMVNLNEEGNRIVKLYVNMDWDHKTSAVKNNSSSI